MKPSDITLAVPPLVGTFGKSEGEHAAALIVRVCQAHGDRWASVAWFDMQDVIRADATAGREPFVSLLKNPFFRPDFYSLVDAGHAVWTKGAAKRIEFTESGLAILRASRWCRVAAEPAKETR